MHRQRLSRLGFLALVGLALAPHAARADLLVSNLTNDPGTFSPVSVTLDTTWAQQFQSGIQAVLTGVTVQLGNFNGGPNDDFYLVPQLYQVDSAGDFPSTTSLVAGFSYNPLDIPTSGYANVTFTPTSTILLDPTKFYWFVLSGASDTDGAGSVDWQFTESSASTGPGALTGQGRKDAGDDWIGGDPGPFLIEVQGRPVSAVPEPATWAVFGVLGLATVLAARPKRRLAA